MRSQYILDTTIARLVEDLSDRDRAILHDLGRLRALSGSQLTRLHFAELSAASRERTRRRVLARLVEHQLVATLERTIGGARAGSAGLLYSLGIAGKRALPLLGSDDCASRPPARTRAPWTPGLLFVAHTLAIAELYVQLVEAERASQLTIGRFTAEPATWYPVGSGVLLKPDAYAIVANGDIEDCWWCEVDRATESIPTLRRKLLSYVDFARSGQLGPDGVVPRVLLTVPHDHRLAAARDLARGLPEPGPRLVTPVLHDHAIRTMITELWG